MKKRFILLIIFAMLFTGCSQLVKPREQEVEVVEPENQEEVFMGDETMDRYERKYVNDAIVIDSDELVDLVAEFWSRITLGDMSFTNYIYLPEEKMESLKAMMDTEDGRRAISKMLAKSTIEADGINEAVFLKINIDSNGNCFKNENMSNIVYTGVSHKYFYDILSIESKEPKTIAEDLIKYIENYNDTYKAVDQNDTAFNFVYVDGKPMIDGELFFAMFGLFDKLGPKQEYITDLVKDAYYEDADGMGDMDKMYEHFSNGEYIWMYELLRKSDLLDVIPYSPKDSIRKLYSLSSDQRSDFMAEMRRLPKPILRFVKKNNKDTMVGVYFYKDMYGEFPTGNIVDDYFEMSTIKNFDGVVIDNVVKNLLLVQDINVDIFDGSEVQEDTQEETKEDENGGTDEN